MTQLSGADALGPTTVRADILGFYPDSWTREQVAASGARGCLPIKVPSQTEAWWADNAFAVQLVNEAVDWGVPVASPLCLDVEENQAEQMAGYEIKAWVQAWAGACRAAGLHPWIYSGHTLFAYTVTTICNRWLADYPDVVPANPIIPVGFSGWQYWGDPNGQSGPDRDAFLPGMYMRPDASEAVLLGIKEEVDMPVLVTVTDPEIAPGKHPYWLLDGTATVVDEKVGDIATLQQKLPASNQWSVTYSLIQDRVVLSSTAGETLTADKPGPVPVPATAPDVSPAPAPTDAPASEEPVKEPPAPASAPAPEAPPSPLSPVTPEQESAARSAGLL
jgi:hypothetical protein